MRLTEGLPPNTHQGGKPSSEYLDNIRIKGYMSAGFALLLALILLLS